MTNKVVPIDKNTSQKVSVVICLKCYVRWVAIRPKRTRLVNLECRNCGCGYVIETGEELPAHYPDFRKHA